MARRKYLHISYIAGTGTGSHTYKSCLVSLTNANYDELYEILREDYCKSTGEKPKELLLSVISLNEISKGTYKILNGGKK